MLIAKDLPNTPKYLSREEVRHLLPKVGDVRMERPTIQDRINTQPPAECVVIEVHPDHLWYRVRFTGSGFIECYKVPDTGRLPWEVEK